MTLYTEQGKSEYVSSITNNNGLDTIVYALNSQRKNDNNVIRLVEFIQKIPRVLILLGQNSSFMERLLANIRSSAMNQDSVLVLLYAM